MKAVGIGVQDFNEIRTRDLFYVDKTKFIREWWESGSKVTLITRPRRFGKTLTMSMAERFFSVQYAGRGEIFEGLEVWEDEAFRRLQGSYPVINLTFSGIKGTDCGSTIYRIGSILKDLYRRYRFILDSDCFAYDEKEMFRKMGMDMPESEIPTSLQRLSELLYRYYGKKAIILLDEYDTPMQEAYLEGYWNELSRFVSEFFNYTFKANLYLERGIITGVTRISRESIFSDLNNLQIVTMTSNKYADIFGFTEQEVFSAMDEMGLADKEGIKRWYDGYVIGETGEIYNPWSVINYLDEKRVKPYWANSSSNALVSRLLREGSSGIKKKAEGLLRGESIAVPVDEEIVFSQLGEDEDAIWSLLLASGYLKAVDTDGPEYELEIVNYEVLQMFKKLVSGWFGRRKTAYHGFIKTLLSGNVEEMNDYLNDITEGVFSYFDTNQREPEKFYHGFVLGLLVDMEEDYTLTSNRESGRGRYDVVIEPKDKGKNAFIIEFKSVKRGHSLEDAAESALAQIEEKKYERGLLAKGFPKERIKKYGFAFAGKEVFIGEAEGSVK